MKRRSFSKSLVLGGIAAPLVLGPNVTLANDEGGGNDIVYDALRSLLFIGSGGRAVAVLQIIFILSAATFLLSFKNKQTITLENSLTTSRRIPNLIAAMAVIGLIYLINRTLFVLPSTFPNRRSVKLAIGPGKADGKAASIRRSVRTRPQRIKGMPSVAAIKKRGRRVGKVWGSANADTIVLELNGATFQV